MRGRFARRMFGDRAAERWKGEEMTVFDTVESLVEGAEKQLGEAAILFAYLVHQANEMGWHRPSGTRWRR
jgi:hypothetical protein